MAVKDANTRVYGVHERSALGVSRWEDAPRTTASWHIETMSKSSLGGGMNGSRGFTKEHVRGVGKGKNQYVHAYNCNPSWGASKRSMIDLICKHENERERAKSGAAGSRRKPIKTEFRTSNQVAHEHVLQPTRCAWETTAQRGAFV